MAAPTFVASYNASYSTNSTPKTLSITTQVGDLVVVYAGSENGGDNATVVPSGNGITFTTHQSIPHSANTADAGIWSGIDTTGGTNWTLTATRTGTTESWGFSALVFRNAVAGASVGDVFYDQTGTTQLALATAANSAVVVFAADWYATSSARTWNTVNSVTPTSGNGYETTYVYLGGVYVALGAYYPDVGGAGTKNYGYTGLETARNSMVALEIKSSSARIQTLTDNFEDGTVDTSKWTPTVGSGHTVTETNGQLVMTLPGGGGSSMVASGTYDLTRSSMTIEMAQLVTASADNQQKMYLSNSNCTIGFSFTGSVLTFTETISPSTDNSTTTARDAANQRWVRLREALGTVYWETSPDRSTWTIGHSASTSSLSVTSMQAYISATASSAASTSAIFDNLNTASTTFRNTAEGQPNGTTLSAANSGGGSGTAFDTYSTTGSGTATYSTDVSMFGSQSYKIVSGASQGVYLRSNTAANAYAGTAQVYVYLTAYPTANTPFLIMYNSGSSSIAQFSVSAAGAFKISDASATPGTSADGMFPLNQWMRLDLSVNVGSTTSNGRIIAQASYANSPTYLWKYDSGTTRDAGTVALSEYRFGKLLGTPDIATFYIDNPGWRSNMIDFIPPESSTPKVAWFIAA